MKGWPSMVSLVEEYLAYRRNLGFQLHVEGRELLRFAKYADAMGHRGLVTIDLALQWANLAENASQLYRARRLEVVRGFARYRAVFDPKTEVPPPGILGPAHRRTQPHIYSDHEIARLIQAASDLSPVGGLRPRTYATLFGLLTCTGLRISEALKLSRRDIDIERNLLVIRETKFHKSRLVPIHSSAAEPLRNYIEFRDRYHPIPESDRFFVNKSGTALPYRTVCWTFQFLRRDLGWNESHSGRLSRIYDLRHTFICRRLLKWYKEGADVEHAISALSTYVGHVKVTDTYWYITGIPSLLAIAGKRFEQYAVSGDGGAP